MLNACEQQLEGPCKVMWPCVEISSRSAEGLLSEELTIFMDGTRIHSSPPSGSQEHWRTKALLYTKAFCMTAM